MSSSSSPLLFMNVASEKLLNVVSPTSTVDIHDVEMMDVSIEANQTSSVDRLTSLISEVNCSPSSQLLVTKKNKISLKTIHNSDIKILKPFQMVLDLKAQLCRNTPVNIADLMIVKNGKELSNCDSLNSEDLKSSKVFVMVKTTAKSVIPIAMKTQGLEEAYTKTLKIPLNIKVGQLKKQLFSSKITTLKPESQRIILGGKVLQDCFIIGDYLLYAMLSKPVVASSSSSPAKSVSVPSSSSGSSNNNTTPQPLATLYLSKTTNLKHEVAVTFVSGAKGVTRELKSEVEISKPISLFNTILHRQFRQPLPTDQIEYVFYLRVPNKTQHTSGAEKVTSKKASVSKKPVAPTTYSQIELDQTKTLLDYGIDTSTKGVTVEIAKRDLSDPLRHMNPLQATMFVNEMLYLYSFAARLKCEAMGVDLTVPEKQATVSGGSSILSLMTAVNATAANKMSSEEEEEGSRSPVSVASVNNKKRHTSPDGSPQRSVSPKQSASSAATHVSTSEKVVTASKKTSGGLFGGLKKGFLSKK